MFGGRSIFLYRSNTCASHNKALPCSHISHQIHKTISVPDAHYNELCIHGFI